MVLTIERFFGAAIESWTDWVGSIFFTYSATISATFTYIYIMYIYIYIYVCLYAHTFSLYIYISRYLYMDTSIHTDR